MQSVLTDEKNRIALKAYGRFFALGEEAKEKDHVKIKPKERMNVMAAIKGKSKLKSLLSKSKKKDDTYPLAFRDLDNEDTEHLANKVVILQHYKGKSIDQVIAELRKEKVDAEKNKDKDDKEEGKNEEEEKKVNEKIEGKAKQIEMPQNNIDLYFRHPGRPIRHVLNNDDFNFALKDFNKIRSSAINIHLHEHLAQAFAGLFSSDDRKILVGVYDIWEVAKFASGYKLITKAALAQMANLIEHRHLRVQNAVLAAFWALAFNHRLPIDFLQKKVLPHLTSKRVRHRFLNYKTNDPEIYTFHVRAMGILACMVCEGGGKVGHVLGDDGIDLLVDFSISPSSPEAHRLGYMALFDAVLGHRAPSLHIVRSEHAVDLLMDAIENMIDVHTVTESMEIICALSRVEGAPDSHFHSLTALSHVIHVIKRFDDEGTAVLGGISQDQWEFIVLCALGTVWGISSGDHCPEFLEEHVEEIIRIAHKAHEEEDEHEEELLYVIFGIYACVAWRGGIGRKLLEAKDNLYYLIEFLVNDSLRMRERAACALNWIIKHADVTDFFDELFEKLLTAFVKNKEVPTVSRHLIETFITLSNYCEILSKENIKRFAFLIRHQKRKELEQYICLLWNIARVPKNKETMAKDDTTMNNLLLVANVYSKDIEKDVDLLYSIICTFWMIIGNNHEHNELCIECGWVNFLAAYMHHSIDVDVEDRPKLLSRLASIKEKNKKSKKGGKAALRRSKTTSDSPRARVHLKEDALPEFRKPTLASHEDDFNELATYDKRCDTWTVVICCLWTLIDHDHAIEILLREKIPTVLLALVTEESLRLTPLLRIRASGILFSMSLHKKLSQERIVSWGSKIFVDALCTTLLHFSDNDTQCYAAMSIIRRAKGSHRTTLAKIGAIERLLDLLDNADPGSTIAEYTSQALLNLSSLKENQWIIPRTLKGKGFRIILRFATYERDLGAADVYPSQIYCAGILSNLILHTKNRTMMYKVELKRRTDELYGKLEVDKDQTNSKFLTLQHHEKLKNKKKNKIRQNDPRQKFLKWLSNEIGNINISSDKNKKPSKISATMPATITTDNTLNISIPSEGEELSHNQSIVMGRPKSPKKIFEQVDQYNPRPRFAGRNNTLRTKMCRRVSNLWEDRLHVDAKSYSSSLFHHEETPHIKTTLDGGSTLDLTQLYTSSGDIITASPWEPSVTSINWSNQSAATKGVGKSGRVEGQFEVVLDPPESPRNHINFTPGGISKNGINSRLAAWPHLKGAKAGAGIFPSFTMPDGQVMYFYEVDRLQEAHMPAEEKPQVPQNDSHFGSPIFPISEMPLWYSHDDPPRLRSLPPPVAPPCPPTKLDEILEKAMADMICFGFKKHTEIKLDMHDHAPDPNAWTLKKSVFAPREYDNDSGTFWDDAETEHVAFDLDWQRCCDKVGFRQFLVDEHHEIHPFSIGDEVHGVVHQGTGMWKIGVVTEIDHSGHATVKFIDTGEVAPSMSMLHLRFPGGEWGGQGGTNPRIGKHSKIIEVDHILPVGIVKDLQGLKKAELRRLEHFTHCKLICPHDKELEDLDEEMSNAVIKLRGYEELIEGGERYLDDCIDIARVKQALLHHIEVAYNAFHYFKSIGNGDCATVQENEFLDFIHLCRINNESSNVCNLAQCRNIYQKVLTPAKHYDADGHIMVHGVKHYSKKLKALHRFEWLEALVRLADIKYRNEAHSVAECVEFLFRRHIEKYLISEASRSSNYFRDERLYFESVDKIFKKNLPDLALIFSAYGGTGITGKNEFYMTPTEYVDCIRDAHMINHLYTIRQAHFCASWSMQLVIDDVKFPIRAGGMTFVDFLECLCRSSEIFNIPSPAELKNGKAANIVEFYEHNLRRETQNIHKVSANQPKSKDKHQARLEAVKSLLNHSEDKHLVNGVHMDAEHDLTTAEKLDQFLLLFITRVKKHAGKLSRDGVGWKVKNILGQHKYRKFPKTRDRRFKINRKHKHKALMFHGSGAVTHPEPITFKGSNIIGDKKEE